ncbi:MAG: EAL domain-containing protein [Pseudomonadota bacterium]
MPKTHFLHKLLVLTIVPLLLAQAGTLLVVMRATEAEVAANAQRSLSIGAEVVDDFLAARNQHLLRGAELLAADFALRETIAIDDDASIRSALANHAERVEADFGAFVDLDGGATSSLETSPTEPLRDLVMRQPESAVVGRSGIAILGDQSYQLFAVPMRAPTLIGYLVFGYGINDALASRLNSLTGLDAEIISVGYDRVGVTASSSASPDARTRAILDDLRERRYQADTVYTAGTMRDQSLLITTPINAGDGRAVVLLHLSLHDAMAPFRTSRDELIAYGAGLVVVVILLGLWFSKSISRPLKVLTVAAERMASGDYEHELMLDSDHEMSTLAASFNRMRSAIAERENAILHQSQHNPLTGLPNKSRIVETLTAITETDGASCGVLSIMLLRMGKVTSTIGQSLADELLCQTAEHLQTHLNRHGVLAHTATHEFVLVMPDIDLAAAESTAYTISKQLQAGVSVGQANIILHTRIGVSAYPDYGVNANDILRRALVARADAQSFDRAVTVYEEGREQFFERQLQVINELPEAIASGEIEVFYQPKIHVATGSILGAEALARWNHHELGYLRPDEFIPAAEESGTIVRLTRHVVDEAIKSIAYWRRSLADIQIAVNLSTRDLLDDGLVTTVESSLERHGVDGTHLILEVTESSIMENLKVARRVLLQLQQLGIRIAMDDFGTGYSSLAQLKNLPLDELKVDKAFVVDLATNPQDELIVNTTIELARGLALKVVAEGIEDEYSIRRLADMGCDYAQGYFIGKPMAPEAYGQWLERYEPVAWGERRSGDRPFQATPVQDSTSQSSPIPSQPTPARSAPG